MRGAVHIDSVPLTGDCQDTNNNKFPAPDNCYHSRLRNLKPGNLAIFIDDMKRPVLQTKISLRKAYGGGTATSYDIDTDRSVLDELGNGYIGFTAATGGERAGGRDTAGAHKVTSTTGANAVENAGKMLGAAQNHEILSWSFCNMIGCVPI